MGKTVIHRSFVRDNVHYGTLSFSGRLIFLEDIRLSEGNSYMAGTNIHYEIKGVRFGQYGESKTSVAITRGDASCCNQTYGYELILSPIGNGEWIIENLGWFRNPHTILQEKEFIQALVNRTARLGVDSGRGQDRIIRKRRFSVPIEPTGFFRL